MSYTTSGPIMILNFFKNRWVRFVVSAGMVVLLVFLAQSVLSLWNKKDIVVERRQVLRQLEAENQGLKDKLIESQSPGFIERVARETLGLVKEGETVVLIPNDKSTNLQMTNEIQQQKAQENLPNWKKWWKLFF